MAALHLDQGVPNFDAAYGLYDVREAPFRVSMIAVLAVSLCWASMVSGQSRREAAASIIIMEDRHRLSFEFYGETGPGRMERMPARHVAIQRPQDPAVLWLIRAPSGNGALRVMYGEVPSGFSQLEPRADLPPALEVGTEYVVTVILDMGGMARQSFLYRGR